MSFYDIILAHPITSAMAIIVVLWIFRIAADFAFHAAIAISAAGAVIVGINAVHLPDDWGQRLSDSLQTEQHVVAEMVASAWNLLLH